MRMEDIREKINDPEIKYKAVNYIGLIPVVTKAVQEQQQLINKQQQLINKQQQTIDDLIKRVENWRRKISWISVRIEKHSLIR
ncbi:MAG: hypothetical protein IPL84_03580 [Chitinophagaceae bacterium]|nr:hypothetical protein [Chitinophagaceae bacterium]